MEVTISDTGRSVKLVIADLYTKTAEDPLDSLIEMALDTLKKVGE